MRCFRIRNSAVGLPMSSFSLGRQDADLQRFVNLLVAGMPLRQPSPVNSPPKCDGCSRNVQGGVTLSVSKAIERAAIAAIRTGKEYIDLAALENENVWRGVTAQKLPLDSRSRRGVRTTVSSL